jgi:hypothetical protein
MDALDTNLYFEVHVTLDPSALDRILDLKAIAATFDFRVADLIKQNGDPSNRDAFTTLRSKKYIDAKIKTKAFVAMLEKSGFAIKRYKIENTIVDSNVADEFGLGIGAPVEWYHYRYMVDDCVYECEFRSKVKDLDEKPELWETESPYGRHHGEVVKDDSVH